MTHERARILPAEPRRPPKLGRWGGYPFEVRYSDGSLVRARAAADVAADAYVYFGRLFAAVEPDIAVIVADEAD